MKRILNQLRKLVSNKLIQNLAIVGMITLVVKGLGFFKEMVVASEYGMSEFLDIYFIAILIPTFIQNVFVGAIKNLFIPNYLLEIKATGNKASFQAFILVSIGAITILLSLVSIIFIEFFLDIVFSGHEPTYYDSIRIQFYIVLPCIFLWGFSSFLTGLLEIESKFLLSNLSQLFLPITTIIFVLYFQAYFGENVLAYGMLIGSALSFLYQFFLTQKLRLLKLGKIVLNANTKMMLNQYPPKVTAGLLVGINPFVDQFFAAQLVAGSIAALNYGIKIPSFAVSIIIIALGDVLLPHFSKLVSENLTNTYRQLFKVTKITFLLGAIISAIMIIFSSDIVRLIFERNSFDSNDTEVVSLIQQIAFVYVPFYLGTIVCVKFLTAINKNHFMAWVSFISLVINLLFNLLFIKIYGVYGLILSTTLVYIVSGIIYFVYTYKLFKLHLIKIK